MNSPIAQPALNPGELYAGITTPHDASQPSHHLILLPARPDKRMDWDAAREWAASVGGDLPTPQEQAQLFANCRDSLPKAWCWSNKEHEEDASSAWFCHFTDGHQYYGLKSFEGSAVAVRRSILESFNPSSPAAAPQDKPLNLKAIRARLDRWELDHLRQVAADTEQKLEDARERIGALEREVSNAWRCAESWQEDAERLVQDLQEAGKTVGLTQAGQLVVVEEQGCAA